MMPLAIFANWKYIVAGLIGLAMLGLGIALWIQTERVGNANMRADAEHRNSMQWEQNFNDASAAAKSNAAALEQYKARADAADKIAAAAQAKSQQMASNLNQIKKELRDVAAKDDRPISRVLGYVFDRLQHCAAAGSTGDCAQGAGSGSSATGAVSVTAIGRNTNP